MRRRQPPGLTRSSGRMAHGFALPFAVMSSPLARTLLSITGFALFALVVALLARTEIRWELWTAGLLGLLAYNVGYPVLSWPRLRPPADDVAPAEIPALASTLLRELPQEAAPQREEDPRPRPEQLSNGLLVLDRYYRIVWCNDAAAAQFRVDAKRDLGRPIASVFRHPSLADYLTAGDFSKALRLRTGGGAPKLSVEFVPYMDSGWLLLSRVARAAQPETTPRECIANVSHELRAPLTVLLGFLETVRELQLDPNVSRDYLDRMEVQCRRMQRIIEDLLRLSALESAPEATREERVDVGDVLARIESETRALSGGRHRIELEAEDGFDLLGAEGEIVSALGNLASNAVRYTPPGGLVRLVWRVTAAGAEFAVEDTGIGIEKKHIPHLTERFYRVDPAGTRGGTGLGLAIVKQALGRHQAALEIKSKPGKGSRFIARFPTSRVVATRPAFLQ
jgi:two-component system, OmpR family, phosphate regulon sensor histidine kinase PhoR